MIPFIAFAAGAAAVKAGVDFFGQRSAGKAAAKQGQMEKELFGKNADLAEQQAADAEARGAQAALRQSFRMRTLLGSQTAALAGQGIEISGTPASVLQSDQDIGEMDRLAILESARREAWGYRKQAEIYRDQGNLALIAGRNRQKEANWASVGTLANFGGDMYDLFRRGR